MITENLSTLQIHKLTQEQYDREFANGTLDSYAIYLTPDKSITVEDIDTICEFQSTDENGDLVIVATEEWVQNNYQLKGDYLTSVPAGYATEEFVTNEITDTMSGFVGDTAVSTQISNAIASHNTNTAAHADIRSQISQLSSDIAAINRDGIIEEVIAALQTPVFGRVDEDNNIILTGNLVDGTYTLKYENAEGALTEIGTLTFDSDEPLYTNQIPLSVDTSGNPYNDGVGYKEQTRINSSGAEATLNTPTASKAIFLTGLIPIKQNDVVRLANCFIDVNEVENYTIYGNNGWSINILFYISLSSSPAMTQWTLMDETNNYITDQVIDDNGILTQFTIKSASYAYMQLCLAPTGDVADAIVTINEEINNETTSGYTNLADPTSADWYENSRINSSLTIVDAAVKEGTTGGALTNYIPCVAGDVIRVKGLNVALYYSNTTGDVGRAYAYFYGEDQTIANYVDRNIPNDDANWVNDGDTWQYTVGDGLTCDTSTIKWCRVMGHYYDGYSADSVIITINEEIE